MRYTMLLLIVGFFSGCTGSSNYSVLDVKYWVEDTSPANIKVKTPWMCKALPTKVHDDLMEGRIPSYTKEHFGEYHFFTNRYAHTRGSGKSQNDKAIKFLKRHNIQASACMKAVCHPSVLDMSFWAGGTANAVNKISACAENAVREANITKNNKAKEEKQAVMQGRSDTCKSYGFKVNTDAHSQCMFDLFKLEKSALESKKLQEAMVTETQRQAEIAKEKRRSNAFIDSMLLLQQSSQYTSPVPTPTIRCRYNSVMSTMTCN